MDLTIRAVAAPGKWCQEVTVEALAQAIPAASVRQIAQRYRPAKGRERKLNVEATLWLVIGWHLFPRVSVASVWRTLTQGLRLIWPAPEAVLASASALVYRRYRLGVRPVAALFHAVCQPLATREQVPSAFAFGGLRVVGVDGTVENVPESAANSRAFGRRGSQRGRSVYPQVLGVYLVECATHVIFEAGFWPATTSEHRVAPRLLRAVQPDMLLLWDGGFHSVALLQAVQARHAQVIGRLPAHVKPPWVRRLADGSALAYLRTRRRGGPHGDPAARLLVRVVTYRLPATTAASPNAGTDASAPPPRSGW